MSFRKFAVAAAIALISALVSTGAWAAGQTGERLDVMGPGGGKLNRQAVDHSQHVVEPTAWPKSDLPPFKKADKNGDGKIEWKEARALDVSKARFDKNDFEHNGKLDRTEWMMLGFDRSNAMSKKQKNG